MDMRLMNTLLINGLDKPLNKKVQLAGSLRMNTPSQSNKSVNLGTASIYPINKNITKQTPTTAQVNTPISQHGKEQKSVVTKDSQKYSRSKGHPSHMLQNQGSRSPQLSGNSHHLNPNAAPKTRKNQRRLNNSRPVTQQRPFHATDNSNSLITLQYQETPTPEGYFVSSSNINMEEEEQDTALSPRKKQNDLASNSSNFVVLKNDRRNENMMQLSPMPSNNRMDTEQFSQSKSGFELSTPNVNQTTEINILDQNGFFPRNTDLTDEEIQKVLTRSNLMTEEIDDARLRNPLLEKIRQIPQAITGGSNLAKNHSNSKVNSNSAKGRQFKNRTHHLTTQRNTVSTQISESQRTPSPFEIESEENLSVLTQEIRETQLGLCSNNVEMNQTCNAFSNKNSELISQVSNRCDSGLFSQHFQKIQNCEIEPMRKIKEGLFEDEKMAISEFSSKGKQDSIRALEEELANFDVEINSCGFDADTVNYLAIMEKQCSPNPHYFTQLQPHLNTTMRAVLLDWMMEVCAEFTLKRETYHYAVNYVDRYLSLQANVSKSEFQLVGVTALFIASKMEEIYPPKVADFVRSCDDGYTSADILVQENRLIQKLKWSLNPPTVGTWSNWYLSQWDLYIESAPFALNHPLVQKLDEPIQFRKPCEKSYSRFREINQLIDCAILDIESLQYNSRTLLAAFMYLVLGKHYRQFTVKEIVEEFPRSSLFLMNSKIALNGLFGEFLHFSFGFELRDLLPSLQYAATFFRLPLNFDLPPVAKMNNQKVLEEHFEEFLAFQTHHPVALDYAKQRPKRTQ